MNSRLYEEALEVAGSYDVSVSKDSAVLYTISYLPTTENRDKAFAYLKKHPKACTIEETVCGKKLVEMGVGYHETGLTQEEVRHIWTIASRRFIPLIKGKVIAFVENADPRSVFCVVELPLLLENENITTINGKKKFEFIQQFQ